MGSSAESPQTGPPKYVAPFIQDILKQSQNLYNNYTPQYYPNSTVAQQSPWTQQGLGNLAGFGGSQYNQNVLGGAQQSQGNLLSASNPYSNPVYGAGLQQLPQNLNYLSGIQQQGSQGLQQAPTTDVQGLSGQTTGNTAGALNSQLNQTPGNNPYVDELVQRTLAQNTRNFNQSVMPQIDNASQIAGGYGGSRQGIAQGIATQGLNDSNANAATQIYTNQYNQDMQRQLQATGLGAQIAGQASNVQLQGLGQQQNYQLGQSAQGLNAAQTGLQNLQSGYGTGVDASGKNLLLAGQTQQLGQTGITNQLQAGAAQDQYNQAVLKDLVDRFNYGQNLPYNQLDQYKNTVYGTSSSNVTNPGQAGSGGVAGALGGAATGAGIAGGLVAAGAVNSWNPVGWAMMGVGALIGSGLLG